MKLDHLSETQRVFLESNLSHFREDHRILGIGRLNSGPDQAVMPEAQDLKLILAVDTYHLDALRFELEDLAHSLGQLLGMYQTDHSEELSLVVCLYDQPMIRVDFLVHSLESMANYEPEEVEILWERGHRLSRALLSTSSNGKQTDPQWIEDRFWLWVHGLASKLIEGQHFEVIAGLEMLRQQALAPLARFNENLPPRGFQHFEALLPDQVPAFVTTLPKDHSREAVGDALRRCIDLYCDLRDDLPVGLHRNRKAEKAVRHYLEAVTNGAPLVS